MQLMLEIVGSMCFEWLTHSCKGSKTKACWMRYGEFKTSGLDFQGEALTLGVDNWFYCISACRVLRRIVLMEI
eukprot:scaffold233997_cov19-Tisochrysis_lutea.AAC.1